MPALSISRLGPSRPSTPKPTGWSDTVIKTGPNLGINRRTVRSPTGRQRRHRHVRGPNPARLIRTDRSSRNPGPVCRIRGPDLRVPRACQRCRQTTTSVRRRHPAERHHPHWVPQPECRRYPTHSSQSGGAHRHRTCSRPASTRGWFCLRPMSDVLENGMCVHVREIGSGGSRQGPGTCGPRTGRSAV